MNRGLQSSIWRISGRSAREQRCIESNVGIAGVRWHGMVSLDVCLTIAFFFTAFANRVLRCCWLLCLKPTFWQLPHFFFLLPLPSIKKSITKPWQSCETTLPGASKHLMPIISENRLEETEEGRLEGAKSLPRGSNICWQTHWKVPEWPVILFFFPAKFGNRHNHTFKFK